MSLETGRRDALAAFRSGLDAVDAEGAVRRALEARPFRDEGAPWIVLAIGKAGETMTRAALEALAPARPQAGGVVTAASPGESLGAGIEVVIGAHPVPDRRSTVAAEMLERLIAETRFERALVLISGGASALCVAPAAGITLADKARTTELLLRSGATIDEINCVRKHLSLLKGGGLARLLAPRPVRSLVISDVIGDDLSVIGSGPLAPDPTTFAEARRVLVERTVWDEVPAAVRERLEDEHAEETPKPGDPVFAAVDQEIVSSNAVGMAGCERALAELGYRTIRLEEPLAGEARDAGWRLLELVPAVVDRPTAVIAGGETTVTLRGDGRGGRNQEMALAFVLAAEERRPAVLSQCDWVFASGGTDGRDGPTDAAGATVDAGSLGRARAAGLDPTAELARNNSYAVHQAAGDLIVTGPTGTNVADLQILLLRPR